MKAVCPGLAGVCVAAPMSALVLVQPLGLNPPVPTGNPVWVENIEVTVSEVTGHRRATRERSSCDARLLHFAPSYARSWVLPKTSAFRKCPAVQHRRAAVVAIDHCPALAPIETTCPESRCSQGWHTVPTRLKSGDSGTIEVVWGRGVDDSVAVQTNTAQQPGFVSC